jgi:general secretion pathway protein G
MIIRQHQAAQQRRRNGFTLMEMLVVVAIIVALASMGSVYFIGYLNDSKIQTAQIQCQNLDNAIDSFEIKHKRPPANIDELYQPVEGLEPVIKDERMKNDPWGKPFNWSQGQPVTTTNQKGQTISAKGLAK